MRRTKAVRRSRAARSSERAQLLLAIEALRMGEDDGKPRSAARETYPAGFNDALDEVLALLRERQRP